MAPAIPNTVLEDSLVHGVFPNVNKEFVKSAQKDDSYLVPMTWPAYIDSKLAWCGSQFSNKKDYITILDSVEIQEIKTALEFFQELELDGEEVDRHTFPLPKLGLKLDELAKEVHHGRGFVSIRGLDPGAFSSEDNIILFLGLSSYIGEKRGIQDDEGDMIKSENDLMYPNDRPIRYNHMPSKFHTDAFCDIVAMQVRSHAAWGGKHSIASSANIYNELVKSRPDLIPILSKDDWPFDIRGLLHQDKRRPVLYYHNDHIIFNYGRTALEGLHHITRPQNLPPISSEQLEALNVVESIASKHQLILDMVPGDLTFVNNFGILHSRESYLNDKNNIRHLVRLWLKNERFAWRLPSPLKIGNEIIYEDQKIRKVWNVVPLPKLRYEIREILSDA